MSERTKAVLIAAGIRALRTFCQALLGGIGGTAVALGDVDWLAALSAAVLATVISVLMSIVTGLPEVADDEA